MLRFLPNLWRKSTSAPPLHTPSPVDSPRRWAKSCFSEVLSRANGVSWGSVTFGLAHFGKKDIRVVSSWSFIHGFLFGLSYHFTRNLAVPVVAHGLFDLGGVVYFQRLMLNKTT